MPELKPYLNVLIEGLKKKNAILNKIIVLNNKQAGVINDNNGLEAFDALVEEKAVLIAELEKVDNGFQSVYDRIKQELNLNSSQYKEEIRTLQGLIREMTDLGVSVETGEMRNKKAIEQYFSYTQKNVNMSRKSVKAASDYYKNMSRVNYIDPQLLDQKK